MGEAKRRRMNAEPMVYHHTSTLRTNLIWMSGVIDVEGNLKKVLHPQLGEVKTDVGLRRSMSDFPPVAWFTKRIDIPNVLIVSAMYFESNKTGEVHRMEVGTEVAHGMSVVLLLGWRKGPIHAGNAVWNENFAGDNSHLCGNKCETPSCRTAQNGHSQCVRLATAAGQRSCNVQDRYSQINGSTPTKFASQAALSQFNGNSKYLI